MTMKRTPPTGADGSLSPRQTGKVADVPMPSLLDDERGTRVVLPADYPAWRRDSVTLSARAKALLGKVGPYVIRVLSFWDHRSTSMELEDGTLDIDASGSYRIL